MQYTTQTRTDGNGNSYTVSVPVSTPAPATPPATPAAPTFGPTTTATVAAPTTALPAAPTAPTSTPATPVASPYVSRYDAQINSDNTALENTTGPAPSLEDDTTKAKSDADAMIATVNANFDKALTSQEGQNSNDAARVRALNISSGTAGSNFASSAAANQDAKGKQAIDTMTSARDSQVASILAGVDDRASAQYQTELAAYKTSIEGDLDRETALKTSERQQALTDMSGLAASGVTLAQLKASEPDTYKQLQSEFGGSDLEMQAAYNGSLPANMQTQYTIKTIKGANGNAVLHRYGINPLTNQLEQNDYDTGVAYDTFNDQGSDIKEIGGTIYRVAKDGSTLTPLAAATPVPKAGVTGSGVSTTGSLSPALVTQFTQTLNDTSTDSNGYAIKGADGYVDPTQYQNALAQWISLGGTQASFLSKFPPANYINPAANSSLPTYLQNLKNQPKASSGRTP